LCDNSKMDKELLISYETALRKRDPVMFRRVLDQHRDAVDEREKAQDNSILARNIGARTIESSAKFAGQIFDSILSTPESITSQFRFEEKVIKNIESPGLGQIVVAKSIWQNDPAPKFVFSLGEVDMEFVRKFDGIYRPANVIAIAGGGISSTTPGFLARIHDSAETLRSMRDIAAESVTSKT
jgi:hypothetical protein